MSIQMTSRERWLAAVRSEPLDRLPFWAKLNGSYAPVQAEPFCRMSVPELHAWMGSEPESGAGTCLSERRTRTERRVTRDGDERVTEYVTPATVLRCVERFDAGSQSWHSVEFPLRTREDVEALAECYADATYELDEQALAETRARVSGAELCLVTAIGTSPMMDYLQHLAGIAGGQYLLADHPGEMRGLFEAMHAGLLRKAELICGSSPADLIYMVENTSTTLLSPAQFREHCLPYLRQYADLAAAHGRLMALHMCGHLRALLADLDTLPVAAFEAFTTPSVGNTTLADGRSACADKCLIGGTNAALWTRPVEHIVGTLQAHLDELLHHRGLVLSSAGVMPPAASLQTIKAVIDWIHAYPVRW